MNSIFDHVLNCTMSLQECYSVADNAREDDSGCEEVQGYVVRCGYRHTELCIIRCS